MDKKIDGAVGKPLCSAIILAGALLAMSSADAAGLGKLNVMSDLGQPLKAEIDIVAVEKAELESLQAKLAPVESYVKNNLPYPGPSLGLQLSVEKRPSGAPYIVATTVQPVNEPFVDILVELTWNGGSILRAYTALLDPPTYSSEDRTAGSQPSTAPEVRPAPLAAKEAVEEKPSELAPVPQQEQPVADKEVPAPSSPAPRPSEPTAAGSGRETAEYAVKPGDTLSKIARQHGADGASLDQMLVLLFRNNPNAFSGKNMNRLKAGRLIKVPGVAEALAVDQAEARREVRLHTANFNAYREQLAAAASGGGSTESSGQATSGSVTAHVEDKAVVASGEPKEVLKLSKGHASDAPASAQERVRNLEEELAARQKTVAEQAERLAMLDKQVKDMQALLEMKNKGMAGLEKSASPAQPPTAHAEKPAQTPAPVAVAPAPLEEAKKPSEASSAPKPVEAPQAGTAASPQASAPEKKKPKVVSPPPATPGLMDQVLSEPLYLGAGAAALGLIGFLGFRFARKRKETAGESAESQVAAAPLGSTLNPEATGGTTTAAPAQVSEEVDPLAEADIYLAYGRDAQAEEILKEAMHSNPRRHEIHLKLLEIYAKRKDVAAFDAVARELQGATGGEGETWLQAANLGYAIDPQNPRYAAGKSAGKAGVAASALAAGAALDEKLDFDIGLNDTDVSTKTDIDLTNLGSGSGVSTDIDLANLTGGRPDVSTLGGLGQQDTQHRVDLDLDLDRTPQAPVEEKPAKLDFDFDLSTLSGAPMQQTMVEESSQVAASSASASTEAMASVSGGMDFDLSKLGLGEDVGLAKLGDHEQSIEPRIDLTAINLDLDQQGGAASSASAPRDDHWYDVQTKFDLAKAYQEMGDKEGAREILREVIAEGDNEQQAAAQRVLETLA
ncbi:MAG TPA: FimV/HubP family polar landmark protein [Burkholderiales bacterium]|nr:FimV/HubP family polar landmark protein [Burkholderiales bacterium]